jgi:hypothetical protein
MERRSFLRRLAGDGVSFVEELAGKPQYRLNQLGELSDSAVSGLRPRILPDVALVECGSRLCAQRAGRPEVDLGEVNDPAVQAIRRFDGSSTLSAIAVDLIPAFDGDAARAFTITRAAFQKLARLGICAPVNPLLAAR